MCHQSGFILGLGGEGKACARVRWLLSIATRHRVSRVQARVLVRVSVHVRVHVRVRVHVHMRARVRACLCECAVSNG